MDDGLIFPYRRSTAHADARVLTHARVSCVPWLLLPFGVVGLWWGTGVWGPSVQVGKRINRGDAQW